MPISRERDELSRLVTPRIVTLQTELPSLDLGTRELRAGWTAAQMPMLWALTGN